MVCLAEWRSLSVQFSENCIAQSDGARCERSSFIQSITELGVVISPLTKELSLKLFRLTFILLKAIVLESAWIGEIWEVEVDRKDLWKGTSFSIISDTQIINISRTDTWGSCMAKCLNLGPGFSPPESETLCYFYKLCNLGQTEWPLKASNSSATERK